MSCAIRSLFIGRIRNLHFTLDTLTFKIRNYLMAVDDNQSCNFYYHDLFFSTIRPMSLNQERRLYNRHHGSQAFPA